MKLNEDQTQVTFTVQEFELGYCNSMTASLDLEFKKPFEYEARVTVHMEEDHIPLGQRRMPYEVLGHLVGKPVEITCDIDPEWGTMTSKPSMIRVIS